MTIDKGIELINELGDITIECKKLTMTDEKGISFEPEKKISFTSEDAMTMKGKKGVKLTNDKEVKIKGKNIKMEGSKGVATGGKQLAVKGDKVMGFDVHQMVIPSGNGTAVVPLPHPFIGKINDKCSEDVKIGGKNVAVKGSKDKHDDAMHMQLPGTIKFNSGPKKEGDVTGGTASKVKINGKEAATIGSTVSTCNDMGMKENSTIIAVGASIPMPAIINPKNMKEYEEEREKAGTKKPQFTTVKWGKSSAKEGDILELSAQVKDIADGNMVTLQVWKDGQDPASGVPQAQIPASVEGGAAKGTWQYRSLGNDVPPDSDPKFFFTAHSAWCPMKKSSSATVELKRPEIKKAEWKDSEGSSTSKGHVGDLLKMSAETKNVEAGVTFTVYNKATGEEVTSIGADVKGDKAEAEWTYHYKHDPENPVTEKPKFYFTVTAAKAKELKSGDVEIGAKVVVTVQNSYGESLPEVKYILYQTGADSIDGTTTSDGLIEHDDLIPGRYEIVIMREDKND